MGLEGADEFGAVGVGLGASPADSFPNPDETITKIERPERRVRMDIIRGVVRRMRPAMGHSISTHKRIALFESSFRKGNPVEA
jgi:hypothetical protein